MRESFTVRKVSYGVGVERTFPVHSPVIAKIEPVTRGAVRRAKLYYLRDRDREGGEDQGEASQLSSPRPSCRILPPASERPTHGPRLQ